ncbi:MAG: hypothetical protein QMC83_09875 [Thermodesulfovibrionales bacterium]|jgi:hypothetical protein|nr:hypothetical protein [Thermodesulfovibrionales bacterium]
MEITINKDELYSLIKEAVREVLHEEAIDFFLKNIPYVSKEEMEDIETLYGKPHAEKEIAYSETIEI